MGEQVTPRPADFGNTLPCSRNVLVAQLLLWGQGQIGPTCYPRVEGRSRTCWQRLGRGSCHAPARSCLITGLTQLWAQPVLDTVAWRAKPCSAAVSQRLGSAAHSAKAGSAQTDPIPPSCRDITHLPAKASAVLLCQQFPHSLFLDQHSGFIKLLPSSISNLLNNTPKGSRGVNMELCYGW